MTEETIFAVALEKVTPAERAAFLDAACTGDAALRRRVEALLASHADPSFLATPAVPRPADRPGGEETRTGPNAADPDEPLDFLAPSDRPDALGRLGHYEVLGVVGRGGMGVVLRAFDEKLHRVVALKVMAPALAASATARRRFVREARAAAAVSHDHVVTIHAVEEAGPLPYIVMQYVVGQSLQDRIDKSGPLKIAEVLRIGMQAARGLEAAHAQGLVHRDVKPANILLENGVERVKLTDFGLARAADDASLTQSGQVAGTPSFMSPEQAEGRPVDARSDLFSLGSVLYAMCTGRPPFRASSSMAVLKRVCEDAPTPVREVNPEVPADLAGLIAELHAKDPAARPASASAVAERLAGLLAEYQHPTGAALPRAVVPRSAEPAAPAGRRGRWAAAAAVVAVLLAGLGVTEAAGVTKLRATVIRIFTPDGTLVVETDDPDVKVTVEGDGGLVITGAGAQEVRVRPGSYKVQAVKDGKPVPLDRDLVTISRGDKQVVRVRVEGNPAATLVPASERGAFVVLGGTGAAEQKFDTLAGAVLGANDGDTIEVRGNGPFVTDPIHLGKLALTIRAGAGFRPVIRLSPLGTRGNDPLLGTYASLVLEGLELQRLEQQPPGAGWPWPAIVWADVGPTHLANCRLCTTGPLGGWGLFVRHGPATLRNCQILTLRACGVVFDSPTILGLVMDNCLHVGGKAMAVQYVGVPAGAHEVQITRSTLVSNSPDGAAVLDFVLATNTRPADPPARKLRLTAADSVLASGHAVRFWQTDDCVEKVGPVSAAQAEALLPRLVGWRDKDNVYAEGGTSLSYTNGPSTLGKPAEWQKYWGQTGGGVSAGKLRFAGGNLGARATADAEKLAPADFRLRADSAGYKAGKGGKDLGADVDLVGPGPAYERWKTTPDYQQWLKDTRQIKK